MARLNAVLLPLYAIGLVAVVVAAAVSHGAHSHWTSFPGVIPAVAQVVPGWVSVVVLCLGLALMLLWPQKAKASAHADPRTEVADPWSARIACAHCGRSYVARSMDRTGGGSVACDECVTSALLRGASAVTSGTRPGAAGFSFPHADSTSARVFRHRSASLMLAPGPRSSGQGRLAPLPASPVRRPPAGHGPPRRRVPRPSASG